VIDDIELAGAVVTVNGGNYGDRPAIVINVEGYADDRPARLTLNFGAGVLAHCGADEVTRLPLEGRINDAGAVETRDLEAPAPEPAEGD